MKRRPPSTCPLQIPNPVSSKPRPTHGRSWSHHLISRLESNSNLLEENYLYTEQITHTARPSYRRQESEALFDSPYLQWYGTVGPDQGRYEFRLIPTGDQEPQFQPIANNQSYTGERSVDAIYETKGIAWLDPRVSYDAEIELLEEGKRTDLHGVSFWRYTPM
jgi:hypothetical protein